MPVRRYLIEGRVQGVGFRFFTRNAARALGLSGFVRNLSDGSVEAVARGSEEALEAFEQSLRRGPAGSRVDAVERTDAAQVPMQSEFVIL